MKNIFVHTNLFSSALFRDRHLQHAKQYDFLLSDEIGHFNVNLTDDDWLN